MNSLGLKVLYGVLSEVLQKETAVLDERVSAIRMNSFQSSLNSVFDFLRFNDHTTIAKEFIDDAQKMPFKTRLEEMRNYAKINIAIIRIMTEGHEEMQEAKKLFKEIKQSFDENIQFLKTLSLRLDALENFLWIVTGESDLEENLELENNEFIQGQQASEVEQKDKYLQYLHEEGLRFSAYTSNSEIIDILNKMANHYMKKAQKENNKINSMKLYQEAEINFKKIFDMDSDNVEAIFGFAKCLLNSSKYMKMINFLKDKANLNQFSEFWLLMSKAYRKKTQYKKAKDLIMESLMKDRKNSESIHEQKLIEKLLENSNGKTLNLYKKNTINQKEKYYKERINQNNQPLYKILSIDGGGVRGIIPALWLCEIEKRTHRPISHLFNMISGTSTGGIIALGLSTPNKVNKCLPQYSAFDIVSLYMEKAKNIFSRNFSFFPFFGKILKSTYTDEGRLKLFNEYFDVSDLKFLTNFFFFPLFSKFVGFW